MQPGETADRHARTMQAHVDQQADEAKRTAWAAVALGERIAEGDEGGVRRWIAEHEHGTGVWPVDPWRLAEHLALAAINSRKRRA